MPAGPHLLRVSHPAQVTAPSPSPHSQSQAAASLARLDPFLLLLHSQSLSAHPTRCASPLRPIGRAPAAGASCMDPAGQAGPSPASATAGAVDAEHHQHAVQPLAQAQPQQAVPPPAPAPAPQLSRYESQKRRDWNTFLQYLRNHRPPLTLARCSGAHVIEFLKYLDQFGKTKVHAAECAYFGQPAPPAPCPCPLRQAWGSLDALIGRLRAAYEESGHAPESNPFAARAVRIYLREVRDAQAKARGIPYEKKKRKRAQPPHGGGEASSSAAGGEGGSSTGGGAAAAAAAPSAAAAATTAAAAAPTTTTSRV